MTPPSSNLAAVAAKITRLQGFRVRPSRGVAIGALVESIRREETRNRRQAGSFIEAWESVIPSTLRDATRLKGLRGGIARVGVRDAATRYELEAGLRAGWLAELRLASREPIRRVHCSIEGGIQAIEP